MAFRREEIGMAGEARLTDRLRPVRLAGVRIVTCAAPQAPATLPDAPAFRQ